MGQITIEHVVKRFGSHAVINDVSLRVDDGEFVVFVGPSGCGKSTLLRLITGLEDLTSGSILIDGRDVSGVRPSERKLAMVFQDLALWPTLNALDMPTLLALEEAFDRLERDPAVRVIVFTGAGERAFVAGGDIRDLDSRWRQYHTRPLAGVQYDYEVVVNMVNITATPEMVREREYEDVCEVNDGFEYILDSRGNVMKDTAGNDLKVPKKKLVRARVFETWQQKTATLHCRVDFYDKYNNNALIDSWPITADAVFENYASTFSGDQRALSDQSRNRLGNRPLPFPSDETLLMQAADRLKPIIKNRISKARVTT